MSNSIYSLQWSAVENAQTYRVFRSLTEVGNKQELVLTSNRSLELNQYISGSSDYYYFIKAQATGYQDSDYSTPLRWKTFSISRSVDAGVIVTNDDDFVGEGFGYNTGFVAPDGKIFNRAVCLLTIGGIQHPEYISFLTGDKAFNIDIPAEAVTGDIVYSAVVQDEITQLAAPTIAMNADGKTLEITDVADATSYDVYVDGMLKTNVASVPNTTTLDLSTLSDIADGTHTVKVKAKANGYIDSEFSNEVSYTKAPVRSFSTDSPAVIQAAVIDGSAINLYSVGDQKEITLTDGSTITIRIVNNSASMYQLSDSTRNTGFVVEFVDCFKVLQYMNASNTKKGGWNSSYMRNTMMNTIFNLLPSEWQNVIPSVNVISDNGAYPSPTVVTSSDKLFLPAEREVSLSSYRDSDINSSSKVEWDALQNWSYYTSGGSRIKKYNNQDYQYWLRSTAWTNTSKFCSISDGGSFGTTLASESLGVAPVFCL